MSETFDERWRELTARLDRTVFWQDRGTPATLFRRLAEAADELELTTWDSYGERGAVARLEGEVAELLGHEDAVLFPSGIMAQQAALRTWCDRRGTRRVALPDLSHLLHHEADGPRRLHGFEVEHLTVGRCVATADALAAVPGALGAALVELPLRDAGCLLPAWEELVALSAAARQRGVPLHADGARIWEVAAALAHSEAEIAGLFDSVYVSLYKGLAAPSGALVATAADVAEELRVWRKRMGGTLYRLTTPAVAGLLGLRVERPRMGEYLAWARALAAALVTHAFRVEGPHLSTFEAYAALPDGGTVAEVNERLLALCEREGVVVSSPWREADVPGWVVNELACYGPATAYDPEVVAGWFAEVRG